MKKITFLIMAALLMLGLAQCKKDDPTPEGEKVSIRLKIIDNSQDDGSKAGISPWTDGAVTPGPGDQIAVAYNGRFVGMLHYYNDFFINDNLHIEPAANITDQHLYFYFLGNRQGNISALTVDDPSHTFSIADQSETYAVLSYGVSTENFDGENTYYAELHNYCGLVKFNLETEVPVDVPVSILGMNNRVTVNFSGQAGNGYQPFTFSMAGIGDVTLNAFINPQTSAVERWVVLPMQARVTNASANATGYGYTPEFTVPPVIQNMYYNQGVDVPAFDEGIVPDINHYFTVSEGTSVYFAPGNLQYKSGTGWRFAENQWDNIGTWDPADWVDHFGWGTWTGNTVNPLNTSENNNSYTWSSADFTQTLINNDEAGWRTLTRDEWNYVLNTRSTTSGIRYAKATVNDVKGLILLPDTWTASTYALSNTNSSSASFDSNVISSSQWTTLQDAGAVFLPAGGRRNGTTFEETSDGYYWEYYTTAIARALFITSSGMGVDGYYDSYKYYGMSVRLARNVEGPGALPNCTVTVTANPSGSGMLEGGGIYQTGKYCTVTATANPGYTFLNWTVNGNEVSTSNPYEFQVTGDVELVANFSTHACQITATANPTEGGSIVGAGAYETGTTCTLTATADGCYHFVSWKQGGTVVSTNATYQFTVAGDAAYEACFEFNGSYTITTSSDPGTYGYTSGFGTYDCGETITLIATPYASGHFVNWTKDGNVVSTTASYQITVTEDAEYVAHFAVNTYTITVSADPAEGGTVSGGGTFNYGQYCTLTATPNSGYAFSNWTKNGAAISGGQQIVLAVTEDATYVAHFVTSYTITASANPSQGGNVSGAGSYNNGATCTLTATPNSGYAFSNWTENGSVVQGAGATYTFTVTGNRTLVANFEAAAPTGPVFSVSSTKRVQFSSGNLYYNGSSWAFEEWPIAVQQSNTHRSAFAWGATGNTTNGGVPMNSSTGAEISVNLSTTDYTDWGGVVGTLDGHNDWRTLTDEEWAYLFNGRSSNLYSIGTVAGMPCMIILPDNWVLPSGCSFTPQASDWNTNTYNKTRWNTMRDAGAICLPKAYYMFYGTLYGEGGYYWSTRYAPNMQAYYLHFNDNSPTVNTQSRGIGCSVRLVRDVN